MKLKLSLTAACVAAALVAPAAQAQDADGAIKARKAAMQLYSFYLGQIGAMAKGAVPYDAEKAAVAATSLASVASVDQSAMWPPGSDNEALGDKTRALPAIWTTWPAITENGKEFGAAISMLASDAGTSLEAMQAALGKVGASCGSCHKAYRQARN